MDIFVKDFKEDATDMTVSIECRDEYQALYSKIQQDNLPKYENRFKKLLNKNVLNDITTFKSILDKGIFEIQESIEHLNSSLKSIEYTPTTYVRLNNEFVNDKEIAEFRSSLRNCFPDVGSEYNEAVFEESFHRIKKIIDRLKEEERWRAKVTDVRNWIEFWVSVITRESGELENQYSDSAGLSGGQKAKLAYTILASSIAYQYGLSQYSKGKRSFRFVDIDEAFSKSDENNSRYAMELFKNLELQLLVVTPLSGIHIVEPYIKTIHFVHNNEQYNDSQVKEVSIEEFAELVSRNDLKNIKPVEQEDLKLQ